ncbi:MAG: hypothetical protein WC222_02970 [Parachlamydiales bacterium]|jgi:hypothetical protein
MQTFRYLFFTLGVIVMFILAIAETSISSEILDSLMIKNGGAEQAFFLRDYGAPLLSLIYGLGFIYLVRNGKLNLAFSLFLSINIAVWIVCAFSSKMNAFSDPLFTAVTYAWLKATAPLLIVLTTGLINQYYKFRYAAVLYPLLLILSSFLLVYVKDLILPLWNDKDVHYLWAIIATCGLAILALYNILMTLPPPLNDEAPSHTWISWLSLFALAFGANLSKIIPADFFKTVTKTLFTHPADYSYMMGNLTVSMGIYQIYALLFCLILGIALFICRSKIYFGIGLFILAFVFGGGILEFLAGSQTNLSQDNFNLISLGLSVNKIAATLLISFVLQLAYFAFNAAQRFSAKAAVHFIFFPLSVMAMKLLPWLQELTSFLPLAVFIAACALSAAGLYKLKQRIA